MPSEGDGKQTTIEEMPMPTHKPKTSGTPGGVITSLLRGRHTKAGAGSGLSNSPQPTEESEVSVTPIIQDEQNKRVFYISGFLSEHDTGPTKEPDTDWTPLAKTGTQFLPVFLIISKICCLVV